MTLLYMIKDNHNPVNSIYDLSWQQNASFAESLCNNPACGLPLQKKTLLFECC